MSRPDLDPVARWVERIGVPLLVAFTLGVIVAGRADEQRIAEQAAAVKEARALVAAVTDDLNVWRDGCSSPAALTARATPGARP
jgi:hypothetical protein